MFDYFQITGKGSEKQYSFDQLPFYNNIKNKIESRQKFHKTSITYLERDNTLQNFAKDEKTSLYVYGTVFTNNYYNQSKKIKPHIAYANEILGLYNKFNTDLTSYLKGSFVLVFIDNKTENTALITDRMNVLPLHFYSDSNSFIISSSIRMIFETGIPSKKVNNQALTEQLLFDYVLENKTYFKDIYQTQPGTIHYITTKGVSYEKYWDVENLYTKDLLNRKESLELLSKQQYENVNLYASDSKKVLVSFTGGFDGRTNVALLNKPKNDVLCYSFGRPDTKSLTIPKYISDKLGYNYVPIELDSDFELLYNDLSKEVTEFSNGTAPLIRANYTHAFKQLIDYSTTLLSGIFGSEILRPLHNLGIMMNDHSEKIFLSGEPIEKSLRSIFNHEIQKNYLNKNIIEESFDPICEYFIRFFEKYKSYDNVTKLFFFLLEEGIRKYFMQEVQHERVYITNRFPYFDDDLLSLIYKTPLAGIYNGFLGKSKVKRRKGQLLYAHMIKRYNPKFGKYALERGYTPNDLLKPYPLNYLMVLKGVIEQKLYLKRQGGDNTFDSGRWSMPTIREILENDVKKLPEIFNFGLQESFNKGVSSKEKLKYSHLISLGRYLNSL